MSNITQTSSAQAAYEALEVAAQALLDGEGGEQGSPVDLALGAQFVRALGALTHLVQAGDEEARALMQRFCAQHRHDQVEFRLANEPGEDC